MMNKVTIAGKVYEGQNQAGDLSRSATAKLVPSGLEVVQVDDLLASLIKEEATLPMPGQRPLDDKTVQEYKRLMIKGLWHLSTVYVVEIVHPDGSSEMREDIPDQPLCYLVNGNHTLQAVIQCGVPITVLFSVFKATREDMQILFSQIDNHRPRRVTTAMEPIARTFGQRVGKGKVQGKNIVPAKLLDMIVTALQWASFDGLDGRPQPPKRDMAVAQAVTSRPFVRWMVSINHDTSKPFGKDIDGTGSESWLWKVPVIAAMWKMWKISEVDATNFWSQVTKPTARNDEVVRCLRDLLIRYPRSKDWGSNANLRIVKVCSMAWRAWRDKQPFDMTIDQVVAISDDVLAVVMFDSDSIGSNVSKAEKSTLKTGSIDRRSSVEQERQGNAEEHHLTVESGVEQ